MRDEQKNQFIRELMDQYELDIEDEHEFTSGVLSEISFVKS